MISSEMPEVLGMADTILVMKEGRVSKIFDEVKGVTQEQILEAAGEYLGEGNGGEDAREAIAEDIGYLDAVHADCILQRAVLGRELFG